MFRNPKEAELIFGHHLSFVVSSILSVFLGDLTNHIKIIQNKNTAGLAALD